jgi:hypothetical protein
MPEGVSWTLTLTFKGPLQCGGSQISGLCEETYGKGDEQRIKKKERRKYSGK